MNTHTHARASSPARTSSGARRPTSRTLAAFAAWCESCRGIPPAVVRAVVRQTGGWADFQASAPDVARHGADGGFSGFIYYQDTDAFARKNKAAILDMADAMARDIGDGDGYALIAGFNCLKDAKLTGGMVSDAAHNPRSNADIRTVVLNALAWFALEECARAHDDWLEDTRRGG